MPSLPPSTRGGSCWCARTGTSHGAAMPALPSRELSSIACAARRHKRRHDKPPSQRLVSSPRTTENDHARIGAAGSVKGVPMTADRKEELAKHNFWDELLALRDEQRVQRGKGM